MIVLGLTGSIAMGKSETARMFKDLGIPVFDADEAVHKLYGPGGRAVTPVAERFPQALKNSQIDRGELAKLVLGNPSALSELEALVHPLVQEERQKFLETARRAKTPLVVLDIPLLFETNAESTVDQVVVVSAPAAVQKERALARPGMTPEKLQAILDKQVPDPEKRAGADFIVDSSQGLASAEAQVRKIVDSLTDGN